MIGEPKPGTGRRPAIIAHRGASAYAADNTIAAIRIAADQGADGVEVDVRYTADRVIVLSHDDRLPGMAPIIESTFEELQTRRPSIARLDELPDAIGEMFLNVEIKSYPGDADYDPAHEIASSVVAWLAANHLTERALVTSFNPETVDVARAADNPPATGLLIQHSVGLAEATIEAASAGHTWVLPRSTTLRLAGRKIVNRAHALGLRVGTWTVDGGRELRRARRIGADAVITNDPAGAAAVYR